MQDMDFPFDFWLQPKVFHPCINILKPVLEIILQIWPADTTSKCLLKHITCHFCCKDPKKKKLKKKNGANQGQPALEDRVSADPDPLEEQTPGVTSDPSLL